MNSPTRYGWNDAGPTYSQSYLEPAVLSLLAQYRCCSVLDLGCGNGVMVKRMNESGYAAVGCEPDEEGSAIARQNAGGARIYRLGVGDEPALVEERPIDAVISTEVIEHLYDPAKLFQFARGVLKPDGHLLVSTPYHGYWKNLALSVADKWDFHHHPARVGGHIKFWSRQTLSEMFVRFGFIVEEFRGVGRMPWLWNSMILVGRMTSLPNGSP
jgi:SAM-dependent methyltransferase